MSNHFLKSDIMIHNNIPQGYKDSALGIIPQEWEVKYLEEVCSIKGGFAFDSKTFLPSGTYQIIKMSNLYNGNLDLSRSSSFIDKLPRAANDSILNAGDILITLTGTVGKKDYGYTYLITDETNLLLNQRVAKLVPHNICPEFIYPTLKTQRFLTPFFYSSRGGTGNQTNVSTKDILDIPILYPPKAEQEKIAEILGVWDSAIEKQSALVDALTRRKRALMQQLLTAKKRLPNFTESWQNVRYQDILKEVKRKLVWNDDELYRLISVRRRSGGLFEREDLYGRDIMTKNLRPAYCGDFLISKMQIVHGASGLTTTQFHDMKVSGSYISLVAQSKNRLCMEYLDWWSRMKLFYHQTYISSYGVHIEKMTFDLASFMSLSMNLPTLPEQQAIAEVLSTADQEIELAKKRLKALRTQKSALMQQLLTGKKRVKI